MIYLLECNCFTELYSFPLYNTPNQLSVYNTLSVLSLPPTLPSYSLGGQRAPRWAPCIL